MKWFWIFMVVSVIVAITSYAAWQHRRETQRRVERDREYNEVLERSAVARQKMQDVADQSHKEHLAFMKKMERKKEMREAGFSEAEIKQWEQDQDEEKWRGQVIDGLKKQNEVKVGS